MKQAVYLAGGFGSNWQERVIAELGGKFTFFNPQKHALSEAPEYTSWDLHFVQRCDILFAYMEATNPSGIGLTLEVGFAKALNKTIVLVDEKSLADPLFARRFKIVQESATITLNSLDDGMRMLLSFVRGIE